MAKHSPSPPTNMPRRNSLRLPPQPPSIPIPPSLRQSPYLNAPIFKREIASPTFPTEEDEKWLQDTVPITSPNINDAARHSENNSAKSQSDRRGSVVQPIPRHFPTTPSIDLTPSSRSPGGKAKTHIGQAQKYLAHSLAPPPMYGGCSSPGLFSGHPHGNKSTSPLGVKSDPGAPHMTPSNSEQGYFPRVPPMG